MGIATTTAAFSSTTNAMTQGRPTVFSVLDSLFRCWSPPLSAITDSTAAMDTAPLRVADDCSIAKTASTENTPATTVTTKEQNISMDDDLKNNAELQYQAYDNLSSAAAFSNRSSETNAHQFVHSIPDGNKSSSSGNTTNHNISSSCKMSSRSPFSASSSLVEPSPESLPTDLSKRGILAATTPTPTTEAPIVSSPLCQTSPGLSDNSKFDSSQNCVTTHPNDSIVPNHKQTVSQSQCNRIHDQDHQQEQKEAIDNSNRSRSSSSNSSSNKFVSIAPLLSICPSSSSLSSSASLLFFQSKKTPFCNKKKLKKKSCIANDDDDKATKATTKAPHDKKKGDGTAQQLVQQGQQHEQDQLVQQEQHGADEGKQGGRHKREIPSEVTKDTNMDKSIEMASQNERESSKEPGLLRLVHLDEPMGETSNNEQQKTPVRGHHATFTHSSNIAAIRKDKSVKPSSLIALMKKQQGDQSRCGFGSFPHQQQQQPPLKTTSIPQPQKRLLYVISSSSSCRNGGVNQILNKMRRGHH